MNGKIVKRYPLSKQVADQLEKMIESGEYGVGDRIPTEVELMDMFSVSRNTVREAVQSLTSAGVLDVKQGDGTYVRSTNRFHANMNLKYAQVSLDNIQEARNSLEISIAHLAAQRRTDEDLKTIEDALHKRQQLSDNVKENTRADVNFHMAIAQSSHNQILLDLYTSISSYLESHILERHTETNMEISEIDRLHEELFMAIRDQDPDLAAVCAKNILKI